MNGERHGSHGGHSEEFWKMKRQMYDKKQDKRQTVRSTDKDRRLLGNKIAKTFKTAEIGAIATIEDKLGFLWKHGESDESLTEKELRFRELWEELREELMDSWNDQKRRIIKQLDYYNVEWQKFQYEFKFIDKER